MAENVMNPGGKRFDWAVIGAGAFLVDALAFDAVFLIRHSDGGFGCCEQKLERTGVGDEGAIGSAEGDVADVDGDGVCTRVAGLGVFPDTE